MYGEAQSVLTKGLSPFARFLLGTVSGLFGVALIWLEYISKNSQHPLAMYGFGLFCLGISFACMTRGRLRQLFGRLIGAMIFVVSLWYLYSMLDTGILTSGSRSQPSLMNAIIFFVVAGLPGLWYAIFAKFLLEGNKP